MDFYQYEDEADKTAIYPAKGKLVGLLYCSLGLAGEAGEVANKVKKILRDDGGEVTKSNKEKISDELGDVLWYIAGVARELDISLNHIAIDNLIKLDTRKKKGTIKGDSR